MSLTFPLLAAAVCVACAYPASAAIYRRYCPQRPVIRPPATALLVAPLAFAAADRLHPQLIAWAVCWLVIVGVPLAVIDVSCRRLPDPLTAAAFGGTLALLAAAAADTGRWQDLARSAEGAAVVAGFFAVLALARPGSAGLGDAKLGLSVGALASWAGWAVLLTSLLTAFVLAGCYGVWLVATRRAALRNGRIPFGPFLLMGCVVVALVARA